MKELETFSIPCCRTVVEMQTATIAGLTTVYRKVDYDVAAS